MRTARSRARPARTLPGTKNLARPAKPCSRSVADDGRGASASRRPSRKSTRSANTPPPRVPLSWSAAPCFAVGSSVIAAATTSRNEPPRGAAAARHHAARLSYIRPRVPSMVSTMTVQVGVVADHDRLVEALGHDLDVRPVRLRTSRAVCRRRRGRSRRWCRRRSRLRSRPCRCRGRRRRRRGCGRRARRGVAARRQGSASRSSAAFSSGSDSLVIEPPPISGPARYFNSPGARRGGCNSTWNG